MKRHLLPLALGGLLFLTACNAVLGMDAPSLPSRDNCSVFPQAGCRADETCQVVDTAGKRTCLASGNVASGGKCGADSDCAAGLACAPTGSCAAYCRDGTDCKGTCLNLTDADGKDVPKNKLCFISCNPLDPQCNGGTCEFFTALEGFTCTAAGTGGQGNICEKPSECQPGFSCTTVGNVPACKQRCVVGGTDNTCPVDTECFGFQPKQIVDGTEFGACVGCLPSPQEGCAAGETCDLTSLTVYAPKCVKAGTLKVGSLCKTTSDCLVGLTCAGVCTEYCPKPEVGDDICEGSPCYQGATDAGPVPGAFLCQAACNPANPTACPGATCVAFQNQTTACAASNGIAVGADCTGDPECVAGAFCSAAKNCVQWCTGVGGQGTCPSGQLCSGFDPIFSVRGTVLGACQ